MKNDVLFFEKQRFSQWWLWLILLSINGLFLYGLFYQVIGGKPFGDKPMSDSALLISSAASLLFLLLFIILRLDTLIDKNGIYVRFFPFQLKYRYYAWSAIAKAYVYHSQPVAEFGGWGMRFSMSGKGRALTVSGEMGLQLEFFNGDALLIGTQKPREVAQVLERLEIGTGSR